MTNDLISREALAEKFKKAKNYAQSDLLKIVLSDVVDAIKEAPAVDAAPVVHGRWIPNIREETRAYPPYTYQNGFKCSLCGRVTRSEKEPYCHCGAKMDKGE